MEVKIQSFMKNKFITVDGSLLTSPYSPEDEMLRFLEGIDFNLRESIVVIYGLGLGNYIFDLNQKLHSSNSIVIIEPILEVINVYTRSNYKIKSDRVHIISCESDKIIQHLEKRGLNTRYKVVYGYMNYRNVFNKEYKVLVENIRNDSIKKIVNEGTIKKHNQKFTKNIFENYFIHEFDLPINAMKEKYNNLPALIVSGGPSLEKNLNYINEFKGVVISGGRTVEEFLKKGIGIDFMVSVDPTDLAYELIKNSPSDGLMPPLFTYMESNSIVIEKHNNKKILMNSPYIRIGKEKGVFLDVIPTGPSVANVSMAIADYLGCNPIVLIGQDLSYTDGKHHADITVKSFDREASMNRQNIEVDAFYGGKTKTTSSFYSMLSWFEQWIKISNKKFFNCTEGGVWIQGCKHISFKNYLEKQANICDCDISNRFEIISKNIKNFENVKNINEYLEKINKMSKRLRKAIYHSKKIKTNIKHINNLTINHHLEELDKIDDLIKDLMKEDSILNYLIASALIDFENEKRKISDSDSNSTSNSNLTFYKNIFKSIEVVKKQLKEINLANSRV